MSNSGKQSPLGVNVLSGLVQGKGFWINRPAAGYMGASTSISAYTAGTVVSSTVLNNLTSALRQGWVRYNAGELSLTTYNNLIAIGSSTIPALGNSIPPTYTYTGNPGWGGAGYAGETASYGFVRLFAWQAYNEFNYNNTLALTTFYNDFVGSFLSASAFVDYSNQSINTLQNSLTFLEGTFSNMDDLITSDITGISLSTGVFGQDLIRLGKAIDLSTMWTFGFPSNLLATLKKYNALTPSLSVALLATGMSISDIDKATNNVGVTSLQQKQIYSAFLIISGVDLAEILVSLNCSTPGLETLADLLNVVKLFPTSFPTLTVPMYNAVPGPTNSKTYYPIFKEKVIAPPIPVLPVQPVYPPGPPAVAVPPQAPPAPPDSPREYGGREPEPGGFGGGGGGGVGGDAGGIGSGSGYQ